MLRRSYVVPPDPAQTKVIRAGESISTSVTEKARVVWPALVSAPAVGYWLPLARKPQFKDSSVEPVFVTENAATARKSPARPVLWLTIGSKFE
jgi:hypothetical protein